MKLKKLTASFLALGMASGIVTPIMAEEGNGDTSVTAEGVQTTKTATLEDDGTYTIDLEAWATGEVKTTTTTKTVGVPCDIVLVLDESGSMDGAMGNTTRVKALRNSVDTFISNVYQDSKGDVDGDNQPVDHRIALVGFSSGTDNKTNGLVPVQDQNGNLNSELSTYTLNTDGGTDSSKGIKAANDILSNRETTSFVAPDGSVKERKQIVLFFTDGYPGELQLGNEFGLWQIPEANRTLAETQKLKQNGATIYSVGVFNSANPTSSYTFESKFGGNLYTPTTNAANAFMHFTSSEYPQSGNNEITMLDMQNANNRTGDGYYLSANDPEELKTIFEKLSQNINSSTSTTTCTLDENAVLKDILGDGFKFGANAAVTAYTEDYWNEQKISNIEAQIDTDSNTVEVTGFDYSENYVVEAKDGVAASGQKLVVKITGVEATDEAITGSAVYTNASNSGIYQNAEAEKPVATLEQPKTVLTKKAYVMDYAAAKSAQSSDWKQSSTNHIAGDMAKISDVNTSLTGTYGTASLSDNALTYVPGTMTWNGYDSVYSFGKTTDADVLAADANSKTQNLWSKVSFIPANNVYFDDTFTVEGEETNWAKIVYTGNWAQNTSDNSDQNTTDVTSDNHGWIEEIAGNTQDSNNTSHSASFVSGSGNTMPTATFNFTGTGVDIYSRCDAQSGKIIVQIKRVNAPDGEKYSKVFTIDTTLQNNEQHYQIPVAHFDNLNYGEYTVTVKVLATSVDKPATFYLDGIRVYNPINPEAADNTVSDAYGSEFGAQFISLRDHLLAADTALGESNVYYTDAQGDTAKLTDYKDFGPKNEVYISSGNTVTFKVADLNASYQIGLKAPNGAVNAQITQGDQKAGLAVGHSSDLYYTVQPDAEGNIAISNMGDNVLAVTKLKKLGGSADAGIITTSSVDDALTYATSFASLPLADYNGSINEEDEADSDVVDNTGSDTDPSQDVEVTTPDVDVEITEPDTENGFNKFLSSLFNGFKRLFN